MASELIFRGGHDSHPKADSYSPKPEKPWLTVTRGFHYLLREQRLLFLVLGVALSFVLLSLIRAGPTFPSSSSSHSSASASFSSSSSSLEMAFPAPRRFIAAAEPFRSGKAPLGLKRKGLRIVVTGGAGFVGSHLVDRLIERGDSVIVVDNFFTGNKENVMHHFGNPRFELIRHDVVEPLLLEVDQIYHLACPASPVHYKHNPVKTIISFFSFFSHKLVQF
ncbi:hypothetical protein vseg_010491 [Gypsophila vaccaria]